MLVSGRVAVVSGVGPGMGRDIALTLARHGADVVLAARRTRTMQEVAGEVTALGRRASCVAADVTDEGACARVAARALDEFGRIDILVNNAFAEEDWSAPFEGFSSSRWRPAFEVNLFGTLNMTRAVVEVMKAQRAGSIVMISSLSIREVNPVLGGYCASKGALTTATHVLAKELAPYNIRVNQVAPGHIWGRSLARYFEFLASRRGISPEEVYEEVAAGNALGRIPTSEEIARVVLFFASDRSSAITGQTLDVNCGRTSH